MLRKVMLEFMGKELKEQRWYLFKLFIFSCVHMESEVTARAAVYSLNKTFFKGCRLNLELTNNDVFVEDKKSHPTKIVVFNLNYKINPSELIALFRNYGQVTKCRIRSGRANGRGNHG